MDYSLLLSLFIFLFRLFQIWPLVIMVFIVGPIPSPPRAISILASTYLPFLLFGNKIGPVGPLAVSETEGCPHGRQSALAGPLPGPAGVCGGVGPPGWGAAGAKGAHGVSGRSRMQTWWRPSPLPALLPATLTSPGLLGLLGQPTDSRPCFLPHEPLPTPTPCPTHPGVSGLQPGVGFPESWLAADLPLARQEGGGGGTERPVPWTAFLSQMMRRERARISRVRAPGGSSRGAGGAGPQAGEAPLSPNPAGSP